MDDGFRAAAKQKISRLLERWKAVEQYIKEAEQISSEAQIPAINELRYASRQLLNAVIYFDNDDLTAEKKEKIDRRITIADQYLYNAEHDIADSIITFYAQVSADVEERFGRNVITSHFPKFPLFREHLGECKKLVADSRGNYELRAVNYEKLRENHIPHLMAMHEGLIDAQVGAAEEANRTRRELVIANSRATVLYIVMLFLAVLALIEPLYLWAVSPEKFCNAYGTWTVLGLLCK